MKLLLIITGLAMLVVPANIHAQSTDQRLQDLEDRIARVEQAQPTLSTHQFHMTGYMSALYHDTSESPGTFSSSFSPLFLYRAGDRFLLEAELAIGYEGHETVTELEYAQLDYMAAEHTTIVAGKFLLPFGIFGERGHPSWINKLPSTPPIYGGHGPSFHEALIPVLTDFGFQVRGALPLSRMHLTYAVYTVNGPRAEVAVEGEGHGGHGAAGPLTWNPTAEDNNDNKAAGMRVGLIPFSGLELGISYYTAKVIYEVSPGETVARTNQLKEAPIRMYMVDLTYYVGGLRVLSEYMNLDTSAMEPYVKEVDALDVVTHEVTPGRYTGYYAQVSYLLGASGVEPVLRYGATSLDGEALGNQTALGVDWWLATSLAVKIAYAKDDLAEMPEPEHHYLVELAFGF